MRESQRLRDAFKYLFQEELDYLYEVTESLPDNPVIVNVGAGAGTSGLAFLEARPDGHVYTIDVTKDDSPHGCLVAEWLSAHVAGVHDRLTQIHGDSVAVGQTWPHGQVDLVFIDGDHTYEGCKGDIETWLAHVKQGGYILVHDYYKERVYHDLGSHEPGQYPHPKPWPGVDQAVDEAKKHRGMEYMGSVATIAIFRRV